MRSPIRTVILAVVLVAFGTGAAVAWAVIPDAKAHNYGSDQLRQEIVHRCRESFVRSAAERDLGGPVAPNSARVAQVVNTALGGWMVVLSSGPGYLGYMCQTLFRGSQILGGED